MKQLKYLIMELTVKENRVLEVLQSYSGTNCIESLSNHIDTILNDCYVGHLTILEEEYAITKNEIIDLQDVLKY